MGTFNELLGLGASSFRSRMCFKKGGGGSTTSTQYTSNLPEYAEPFYTNLMERAEATSQEGYQPYTQPRVAGFDPMQQQAFGGAEALYQAGNPSLSASQYFTQVGLGANLDRVLNPDQMVNTYGGAQQYNPLGFTEEQLQGFQIDPSGMYADPMMVGTRTFNPAIRDYYMSPYQDAVTERLKAEAIQDAERQQKYRDTQAVQAGAFGGDRRFVMDALADEALGDRLTDISTFGRQSAFENAQQQFERDRAARLQADLANQGVDLQASGINLDALIRSGGQNQDAVLQALGLGEQSRQFGADIYEQGSQFGSNMDYQTQLANRQTEMDYLRSLYGGSESLGALGGQAQNAFLDRLNTLYGMGGDQQAYEQTLMDRAYEDFINQRDYQRNALTWLSGILHGVPVSSEGNTIQYQQSPNVLSQALGSGIAGYSLYNALQ